MSIAVLADLGAEIGPLITGAGIFGIALGFGSQTLVKDTKLDLRRWRTFAIVFLSCASTSLINGMR